MTESQEHIYFLNSLYRDFLFPTILGEDTNDILYWAGKRISRQYALSNFEDLQDFFKMANFGELTIEKKKHGNIVLSLKGQSVADRLDSDSTEFSLECGIISECLQKETGKVTEAAASVHPKDHYVTITTQSEK